MIIISFIFFLLTTSLNIITRTIFSIIASTILLLIHGLKLPGEAMQGALEQAADAVKAAFGYIMGLVLEVVGLVVCAAAEQAKETVVGMVGYMFGTMQELLKSTRSSVEGLVRDLLREVVKQLADLVTTVLTDLFNNYVEAFGYLIKGGG